MAVPRDGGSCNDARVTAHPTDRTRALVGRDAELEVLGRQLADSARGLRLVLVGGEQGVGKTALVGAFTDSVCDRTDVVVVRGFCLPVHGEGLPFGPVAGALQGLEARFGADRMREWAGGGGAALSALLPHLAEAGSTASTTTMRVFDAVSRVWRGAAGVGRLVVVLEDLHWADESSRAVLQFLVRALVDAPVLVIGTFRSDELDHRHPLRTFTADVGRLAATSRVLLPRLDRDGVAAMLTRLAGTPPTAEVLERVVHRSGGVPFYVEELARPGAADGLPEAVRDVVGARVHGISPQAQAVVRCVAVGGLRVPHDLLLRVLDGSATEAEAALREAVDAGVLVVDGNAYAFRHALFAEAAAADLLPGERARLHAAYAQALEAAAEPTAVARHAAALHWAAAGDAPRAFRAALAFARSGSVARAEVHQMYERVLDLWHLVDAGSTALAGTRPTVLTEAAQAATDAGEWPRALELLGAALDETADADVTGRIDRLIMRSQLLSDMLLPGADRDATAAGDALEHVVDESFRARTWGRLARLTLHLGDDAGPLARAAAAAAAEVGDAVVEANARITLGTALTVQGNGEAGLAELDRAGALAVDDVDTTLRLYVNASDACHLTGLFERGAETALVGLAYAREHGIERSFGAYVAGNAAESLLAAGDWARARELLDAAVALDPPGSLEAHVQLLLAWLLMWQGRTAEPEAILEHQRPALVQGRQPQFVIQAMRIDGELATLTGRPERAWRYALEFAERPGLFDVPRRYPFLATAAAAAAALDRADPSPGRRALVERLLRDAPRCAIAPVWTAVARAELADDVATWERAAGVVAGPRAPAHLLPYVRLRQAERMAADGERASVGPVLDEASARAARLGANLISDRVTGLRSRLGLARGAGLSRDGTLAALTARELAVLRLVSEGRSNGQIAAELFISPKTVSVHVSNILAKLGVAGRGEAAAVAHRAGLLDA